MTWIRLWAALAAAMAAGAVPAGPADLLPRLEGWKPTEAVRTYSPEALFEYIDGAAEAYLGYDFRALAVAEYLRAGAKTTVTAEIYDMGSGLNAFGMYSAERYPESRFLPIGVQGYYEEGTLNFFSGRYYVKLLCFEGGERAAEILGLFARTIAAGVKNPGAFPALLAAFPAEGRVANSERYLARNVLGLKFLSNGYAASYRKGEASFDAYLIETRSEAEAGSVLEALAGHFAAAGRPGSPAGGGLKFLDPYLKTVYGLRAGNVVCLLTKVEPGAAAEKTLAELAASVRRLPTR